jgi:hypothetical protein
MNKAQIFELIENNDIHYLQICDTADNKLFAIDNAASSQDVCNKLDNVLDHFKEYKKVKIRAKDKDKTNFTNGFTWFLDFPKTEEDKKIAAPPNNNGTIGAMELVTLLTGMQKSNFDTQLELFKAQSKAEKNDPAMWIPLIREAMPILGYGAATPPPSTLVYGDIDASKLNAEEKNALITENLIKINEKISPDKMYTLGALLLANADLTNNIDKIFKLLNAINVDPSLLDKAMMFVK